jgi:hypothetical protein
MKARDLERVPISQSYEDKKSGIKQTHVIALQISPNSCFESLLQTEKIKRKLKNHLPKVNEKLTTERQNVSITAQKSLTMERERERDRKRETIALVLSCEGFLLPFPFFVRSICFVSIIEYPWI